MWKIYDDLIAVVPDNSVASSCLAGLSWFLVRSQGIGVAMRPREGEETVPHAGERAGMKTRELAAWVKSWNPNEAALGLAAINFALNAHEVVERRCDSLLDRMGKENVFTYLLKELRGKKVAVIGHFRDLERIAAVCDLTILERRPEPGDLPDIACEFVLPKQQVVIMTATTLINKTLSRHYAFGTQGIASKRGIVAWIERRPSFPLLSRFTRRYLDGERSPGVPRPACG
jgi:uncharacterized protein (DUF4213/DUF364 family)